MKHFDIDSFDPEYTSGPTTLPPKGRKLTKRQAMANRRAGYVSVSPARRAHRIGVRQETMRAWRGLERRMHQIDAMWHAANEAFWTRARSFARSPGEDGVAVIAISDPASGDDTVLKVDEHSFSYDTQERMVASLLTDPDREGNFVMHGYGEGGRELGRLLRRESRLHRTYGLYKETFERAITDRLKVFASSRKMNSARFLAYSPAVVVVENEGRQYIFSMDGRGFFARLDGEIFRTGGSK